MIIALWHRWTKEGRRRWLLLCGAVILLDVLIGSALLKLELELLRDMLR
jgi:hypothetical protein